MWRVSRSCNCALASMWRSAGVVQVAFGLRAAIVVPGYCQGASGAG